MRRAAAALAAAAFVIPVTAGAHPFGQRPEAYLERDSTGVRLDLVIAMDEVRVLANHLRLGPIRPEALADAPALVAYLRESMRLETGERVCEMARIVLGSRAPAGWSLRTRFECGASVDGVLATVTFLQDVSPDYVTLWQAATTQGRARGSFTSARPSQRVVFSAVAPVLPSPSVGPSPEGFLARVTDAVQTGRGLPVAFVLALLLGAAHALAPGHGKTIAAAVMVSGGGRRRALALAAGVAGTHLVSVGVVSGIAVAAGAYALPRGASPVLQAVAGAIGIAIGVRMWRAPVSANEDHDDGAHVHPHARATWVGAGIAGGLIPSPGAVSLALIAFAAGKWLSGIAVIAAFSVGLASVIFAIALLAARGREVFAGRGGRAPGLIRRIAAAAVAVGGAALVVTSILR